MAKQASDRSDKRRWYNRSRTALIFCAIALLALLCISLTPKLYHYEVGDVAEDDIYAPRDAQNETATAELKQRARDAVAPVYTQDGAVTVRIDTEINAYYDAIVSIKEKAQEIKNTYQNNGGRSNEWSQILSSTDRSNLCKMMPVEITEEDLYLLLETDNAQMQAAREFVLNATQEALKGGIKEEDLDTVIDEIHGAIDDEGYSRNARDIAKQVVSTYLSANTQIDEEATEAARKRAEDAVVAVSIKKGELLVKRGDVITQSQLDTLQMMGMSSTGSNIKVYLGSLLAVIAFVAATLIFMKYFGTEVIHQANKAWVLCCAMLITLIIAALMGNYLPYMVPVCFASMIAAVCMGSRYGIMTGFITAAFASIVIYGAGVSPNMVYAFFFANIVSTFLVSMMSEKATGRGRIMLSSIIAGAAGAVIYACLGCIYLESFTSTIVAALHHVVGCALSGILALGSLSIWEVAFQLVTPMRLMEMCSPNSELLKQMAIEAPGTYHHSIMVANLAEAAAQAIGADYMLARTCAYYHDVGKLGMPMYFSENQVAGYNPHDLLTPEQSAEILRRHTTDGETVLLHYGFPPEMARVARTHHGNSVMMYFFNKAIEQDGEGVDIEKFRYHGGLPTTREEAIIMLADSVEAAVRSNPEAASKIIRKIIRQKMDDGQLKYVPMTFEELERIIETFEQVLVGAYHKRIQYPDINEKLLQKGEE